MSHEFAKSIGCNVDTTRRYPLSGSTFLHNMAQWTNAMERETLKRMNDGQAGGIVKVYKPGRRARKRALNAA